MLILLGLFIANRWGLEQLAAYTVAAAMIAIASLVAGWGAPRTLPRDLALLTPGAAKQFLVSASGVPLLLVAGILVLGVAAAVLGWLASDVVGYLAVLFALCPAHHVPPDSGGQPRDALIRRPAEAAADR
jgi:hypothetical protein